VKSNQAQYCISTLCRVLGVSASGYYAWSTRRPSARKVANGLLGDRLEAHWRESREIYGRPRLQADLREEGIRASDKRVARLMRERNIHGASRRKGFKTTVRDRDARPAPDLVERKFVATAPNQLWVADITYTYRP
jgi:putative transposase